MRSGRPLLSLLAAAVVLAGAGAACAQGRDGAEACDADDLEWAAPALANAQSLGRLEWTPFGAAELGWEAYLPLIQHELGTGCAPGSPVFARALAGFQGRHGLPVTGWFDPATFQVFRGLWQERRPFIMARVRDEPCPEPPPLNQLGYLVAEEEHADRLTRLLRRDVLDAYRRMVAAARAEVPEVAADPELLQIFSGFRDPEADAARCAQQGNCDGLRRAVCSPHRTGAAVDLYVGHLAGLGVDDTSPASRLHMSRGPVYRWLVRNAGRFGFTPYVYEPWHWEWTGVVADPPVAAAP
ncbi:MAG: D-alanyl-D-alanine carboxypeptidase family protein [Brevundimonas sp.]|uniref:D-alanyl-D-alanine carboxypeptidase family protein n=1 Tax=Brevundimonas sp. TaxID=1871086 RepID=UPI0017A6164D|nr:D-alanyl-D-alanine carboxypeptidase family protein [Brevundimonas sp.]MBA4803186.1 D-alanyl-D-alanine carboxypeptidase family protein [Brevundimonas sp.]